MNQPFFTEPSEPVHLHVREEGHGDPVLFLHGFADTADTVFEAGWAAALGDARVIAFDARGHGRSARPLDVSDYDDDARVDDALRVLDARGIERAHVVGYSMGGWTALHLAARAPERVATLAIGGAHAGAQSLSLLRHVLEGGVAAFVGVIERFRTIPLAARSRILAGDADALRLVIARDRVAMAEPALARLTMPVLLWVGEHDALRPHVEALARTLADAQLVIVPGVEHFAAFDAPVAQRAVARHVRRGQRTSERIASMSRSRSSSRNA